MLKTFILFLLYFVKDASMSCVAENQYSWSYHGTKNGPSHWKDTYPNCSRSGQAPLKFRDKDVVTHKAEYLVFKGFDQPITKAKVQNLGWTVVIIPQDDVERGFSAGTQNFTIEEIRFHFGTKNQPGAENIINGIKHTMEIEYYMDDENGYLEYKKGFLSTLMDIDDNNNPAFNPITDVLPDILYRDDSTELKTNLNLNDLLPKMSRDTYYYYTYFGYNPIPPCDPLYFWWILKDVGKVGKDQLDTFMKLYSVGEKDASNRCRMGPNYRPAFTLDEELLVLDGPSTEV